MSILAIQNRFGFFPWEWNEFSFWQKLRMHFDAYRLISHYRCSFMKDRAEIWRGRVPIYEHKCTCGDNYRLSECWCECSNGVLRQGKYNRKGEKVTKYEKRFTERAKDSKLWEINREAMRLIGEFVVPSYYGTDCWQGYKARGKEDDGRNE